MPHDRDSLDARLLAAHDTGEHASLPGLYLEAATRAEAAGNPDACAFFLTHAYIWALDLDHPDAPALRARLVAMGRDLPER